MIAHLFNSSVVSGPELLALPALRQLGEPVSVVFLEEERLPHASKAPIEYARSLGHTVFRVPVRSRWDRKSFQELRCTLDQINPEVVHAHDVKASLYLYQAKRLRPGFRASIVSTHHGTSARRGRLKLYEEYYVRRVLPRFDSVLCVCESDRASVLRRGVPEGIAVTHLNGVDRPLVSGNDRESRSTEIRKRWRERMPDLPGSEDALFFGAVARLSAEKRHDRILNVMALLKFGTPIGQKPILLCFGSGKEEARLKALSTRMGLDERVFWMGYSPSIGEEMAGLDLLLSLSDGEGIPISFIEAGWSATPVFATAVGGVRDLIPSEEFGWLVKKEDSDGFIASKLLDVLAHPAEIRKLGRSFQRRVASQFSQEKWLTQLRQIYGSLKERGKKMGAEL